MNTHCLTCRRLLDVPGSVGSRNCGGDCMECVADYGDPDAIKALDGYVWQPLDVRPMSLGPGLVPVSREEFAELGIPVRSLRGWPGLDHDYEYVDRRCLKRYRRRAGRRT